MVPVNARAALLFLILPTHVSSHDHHEHEPFSEVAEPSLPIEHRIHFNSVLTLKQDPQTRVQIRGGEIAKTDDWPASLYAQYKTVRGTAVCTAALVGPKAMLTAAHCVPSSGEISFNYRGVDFVTDCTSHPAYAKDRSADFALCKVRETDAYPNGVNLALGNRYERINTGDMDDLVSIPGKQRIDVLLTGFGCISDIVEDDVIDGFYRTGRTHFVESSNTQDGRRDSHVYVPQQANNLITVGDSVYANLCPGDSGGPAFGFIATTRVVIGVNSRVFYADSSKTTYGASLVSATGGPDFRAWAKKWSQNKAAQVCGIRGGEVACK